MSDDLERAIVDALVRHGYAGGLAGEILLGGQAHEMARMLNREVIAQVREKARTTEASRRDWAAEAMRLQRFIETKMFPGVFGDPEPPIYPTICACITDEQSTQLGPGFSRPECAVHPAWEPGDPIYPEESAVGTCSDPVCGTTWTPTGPTHCPECGAPAAVESGA